MISYFSNKCYESLNQIAIQLNLPKIEINLRCHVSRHDSTEDYYIPFRDPSLLKWFSAMGLVSQKLLESSYVWEYPLSRVLFHQVSPQGYILKLFVNHEISIPKVMQEASKFISSPSTIFHKVSDLIISTHCDEEREDWNNLRIRYFSEALRSMTNSLGGSHYCSLKTIPTKGDLSDQEKLECYRRLECITRKQEGRLIASVSCVANLIQPRCDWSEVQVTEQISYWVSKLSYVIKEQQERNNSNRVIVVTNEVLFVPLLKSVLITLSLLGASSISGIVIPVSRVSTEWNLSEYSAWLKNYIITKSVVDDGGKSLQVNVDEDLVYKLYQTCLRLTLLSSPHDSLVKVLTDKATQCIFIQYNIARITILIRRYQSEMQIDEEGAHEEDFSSLSSDEWTLINRHVSCFKSLAQQIAVDFTFHRLIYYLHKLCKDLSSYYRKVRILVQDLPHTRKLIKSRIWFLRVVRGMLILSLEMMSVKPVEEM